MRRLVVFSMVLVACSSGGGGDDTADAGGGSQCAPGAPFDLNGRAAVLGTLNVHVNASGLVETDTTAELLLLLDVTQTAHTLGVVARICDITIPDVPISGQDQPIHFELGPGLLESVDQVSGTGSLDGDTTCAAITSDPITVVIGARLDMPETSLLPQASSTGTFTECLPAGSTCAAAVTSNNCACDQENDGNPGATLLIMNAPAVNIDEVYVNLRTTFSLTGEVWSSDLLVGTIDATLEQGVLACHKANNASCSSAEVNTIKSLNPVITQLVDDPSTFRAVGVDSGMDCPMLLARRDELFPR